MGVCETSNFSIFTFSIQAEVLILVLGTSIFTLQILY